MALAGSYPREYDASLKAETLPEPCLMLSGQRTTNVSPQYQKLPWVTMTRSVWRIEALVEHAL